MTKKERYNFMNGLTMYEVNNKVSNINDLINQFFNKTLTMFYYDGLPETLPYEEIEKLIQVNGIGWVTKYNEDIVILPITLMYDEVDIYGNAKRGTVYYADTRETKQVDIADGVLIYNDFLGSGLTDIFKKYAYLINESDVSLNVANIWKRTEKVFTANDDNTAESIKNYLEKVKNGEFGVIVSNLLYDSLNITAPTANGSNIHDLIEYNKYIRGQFYSEIGLYANDNMKKERLITSEIETGLNAIYPLVDNMLNCRQKAIDLINDRYNMTISVEFNSSWEYRLNLGENMTHDDITDGGTNDTDL